VNLVNWQAWVCPLSLETRLGQSWPRVLILLAQTRLVALVPQPQWWASRHGPRNGWVLRACRTDASRGLSSFNIIPSPARTNEQTFWFHHHHGVIPSGGAAPLPSALPGSLPRNDEVTVRHAIPFCCLRWWPLANRCIESSSADAWHGRYPPRRPHIPTKSLSPRAPP
jgi:hypothetical protein